MPKLRQFANSVLYVVGILSKVHQSFPQHVRNESIKMLEFMYNVFRYVSCVAAFLCNTILVYYVQYRILCRVTSFALKIQKKGCYSYYGK